MWKSRKFIIITSLLAAVLLFGITGGLALAQDENDGPGQGKDIMARVAQILGIDQQKLTDAFKQAQTEFKAQRLDNLVKDGKITQEQADQLKAWEAARPDPKADPQKFDEWLKSRPDVPFMGPPGPPPNMDEMLDKLIQDSKITQEQADQFKAWEAAKPDPKADPQKFDEWLKSRPDIPFMGPPGPRPFHRGHNCPYWQGPAPQLAP
jgi:hypothetical protein